MADIQVALTGNTRVFYTANRGSPAHAPVYAGHGRSMGQDWPQGDESPIFLPSEDTYGAFEVVGKTKGAPGLPTQSVQFKLPLTKSDILDLVGRGCPLDLYTMFGQCKEPSDFNGGWTDGHVRALLNARITGYSTSELGSFDGTNNEITEDVPMTGDMIIQISPIVAEEQASTEVTDPIVGVSICDRKTCGECGMESDGCQIVFALTSSSTTGSPGLPAELLYTTDGGNTWSKTNPPTIGLTEIMTGLLCVGANLVLFSNAGDAMHYAPIADILAGTATWTKVVTGIVAAGSLNAMLSRTRTKTWGVGDGGYIYFSTDVTSGLTAQLAGTVTSQNLLAIDAFDSKNLIVGGASNVILVTRNGGASWGLITGPAVGITVNAVKMIDKFTWLVGMNNGTLYYTQNGGVSWTQKAFPGSGAGVVRRIAFANRLVGYMAHDTAAVPPVGRLLRTIDGGYSWYVAPEAAGFTTPNNRQISAIAPCEDDPNVVFAGGINASATDGILLKFA